jgi:hypothetical protein
LSARLPTLASSSPTTLDALRRWRAVFGRTPAAGLNKNLLARMLAWRLQEQAFGGLDRESLSLIAATAALVTRRTSLR